MLQQKRIMELRNDNGYEEFTSAFKCTNEAYCKSKIEKYLVLQDVSDKDYSQATNDVERFQQNIFVENLYSNTSNHRQCPLRTPKNIDGLVGSDAFWQELRGLRTDIISSQICSQAHKDVPVPISMMAQHLQNQMKTNTKRVDIASQFSSKGDKSAWDEEQDVLKGGNSTIKKRGLVKKLKASGSRMMKCLRRMFSCGRTYVEVFDE